MTLSGESGCHSNQLGHASDPHLRHHVTAVNFCRFQADSEDAGDLLVLPASNDVREDLFLARRQFLKQCQGRPTLSLGATAYLVLFLGRFYRLQQRGCVDRLYEDIGCTRSHRENG